jgi:hypothetical protein
MVEILWYLCSLRVQPSLSSPLLPLLISTVYDRGKLYIDLGFYSVLFNAPWQAELIIYLSIAKQPLLLLYAYSSFFDWQLTSHLLDAVHGTVYVIDLNTFDSFIRASSTNISLVSCCFNSYAN